MIQTKQQTFLHQMFLIYFAVSLFEKNKLIDKTNNMHSSSFISFIISQPLKMTHLRRFLLKN